MSLKNWEVIGRPRPSDGVPNPPAIRVQVFAADPVTAKSHFWKCVRTAHSIRLKKAHGEILAVRQVIEPEPGRAKTYGVWFIYNSVRGTHNLYKEFRDVSVEGAVHSLFQEMAGTHSVKQKDISIIRIQEVADAEVKHRTIKQFTEPGIKYPILKREIRPSHPYNTVVFASERPQVAGK